MPFPPGLGDATFGRPRAGQQHISFHLGVQAPAPPPPPPPPGALPQPLFGNVEDSPPAARPAPPLGGGIIAPVAAVRPATLSPFGGEFDVFVEVIEELLAVKFKPGFPFLGLKATSPAWFAPQPVGVVPSYVYGLDKRWYSRFLPDRLFAIDVAGKDAAFFAEAAAFDAALRLRAERQAALGKFAASTLPPWSFGTEQFLGLPHPDPLDTLARQVTGLSLEQLGPEGRARFIWLVRQNQVALPSPYHAGPTNLPQVLRSDP